MTDSHVHDTQYYAWLGKFMILGHYEDVHRTKEEGKSRPSPEVAAIGLDTGVPTYLILAGTDLKK